MLLTAELRLMRAIQLESRVIRDAGFTRSHKVSRNLRRLFLEGDEAKVAHQLMAEWTDGLVVQTTVSRNVTEARLEDWIAERRRRGNGSNG